MHCYKCDVMAKLHKKGVIKAFLSVVIHTLPNKQKFPSSISGGHIIMSNNRS